MDADAVLDRVGQRAANQRPGVDRGLLMNKTPILSASSAASNLCVHLRLSIISSSQDPCIFHVTMRGVATLPQMTGLTLALVGPPVVASIGRPAIGEAPS